MKRSGQSLVEVMIALSILVVGFMGILTLLAQSIFLSRTVSNETVATYLAAEGIEISKNLIDHDVYAHLAGIGTGWGSCFVGGPDFEVDYTTTNCPPQAYGADVLYYNPTTQAYGYDTSGGAVATAYTRRIRVTPSGGNEITELSIVSWNTGPFTTQDVTLEDHFYNWHP